MQTIRRHPRLLASFANRFDTVSRRRWYNTRPKEKTLNKRRNRRFADVERDSKEASDSDIDPFPREMVKEYEELESELRRAEPDSVESQELEVTPLNNAPTPVVLPEYRIRHSFVGFDPRRMDLESFPRLRTDFDGKQSGLVWMGTECQRCGLQIRRERRTNRETSLNVYASPKISDDLLRHCPEEKVYPVLWRTRDPYAVLDILAVEDY